MSLHLRYMNDGSQMMSNFPFPKFEIIYLSGILINGTS